MAEHHDIILEHLRHIRGKVDATAEAVKRVEARMSSMERHSVADRLDTANQRDELDDFRSRIERIERRLELRDPEH